MFQELLHSSADDPGAARDPNIKGQTILLKNLYCIHHFQSSKKTHLTITTTKKLHINLTEEEILERKRDFFCLVTRIWKGPVMAVGVWSWEYMKIFAELYKASRGFTSLVLAQCRGVPPYLLSRTLTCSGWNSKSVATQESLLASIAIWMGWQPLCDLSGSAPASSNICTLSPWEYRQAMSRGDWLLELVVFTTSASWLPKKLAINVSLLGQR